ncbi:MAG TPA: nucleoside triphosphate pyrophosphohydrolase [Anaerolineales bacterium]|nr:nucleoside triphosphate pyrophosphohydrolase [Anaerolineales bacterium]
MCADITIIGLGPGESKYITREVWEFLETIPEIYLRTRRHPAVSDLPPTLVVHSFDHFYSRASHFEEVYEKITERILKLGRRKGGVVYGVPGDPHVAESTTEIIRNRANESGLQVEVLSGLSFIEPVLKVLGLDPLPRLALVDALELANSHHPAFPPDFPALIPQVYDRDIAAATKLTLMGNYPDAHPVFLVHGAGSLDSIFEELPLFEIDRSRKIGPLTCLYVPALSGRTSMESFQNLIAHLRAPEGCPWDREQTHLSLRPYLLEETYEVLEALDRQDIELLSQELGDLLLQIVLHAQIAAEDGDFGLTDIIMKISEKLIYRHPHVFAGADLRDSAAVKENWEKLKLEERKRESGLPRGTLDGIPPALPALSVAGSYQVRAAGVGFDWPDESGVIAKIQEELGEVLMASSLSERSEEIGDLLFAVVNLARWSDLDAETLLREANARFRDRFEWIEERASQRGRQISDLSIEEMNSLWEEAKAQRGARTPADLGV